MNFIFGILTGLMTSALIFAILCFFRVGIEKRIKTIERVVDRHSSGQRGAIFWPEPEEDIVRQEHINKNKEMGKDTPIDELL